MLTVLMPVFNVERFVAQAIESVLAQTHQDFSLLIIDDGSKDNTLAVCRELEAKHPAKIRVLTQPNAGIAHTLNRGLEIAQRESNAEWVAIMHGDDVMAPNRLERQLAFIDQYPRAAVVSSYVNFIDTDGKLIGPNRSELTTEAAVAEALARRRVLAFNHPAVMLRPDAVKAVGGYRQEFWPAEDVDLWNRIAYGFNGAPPRLVLVQNEYLLNYRVHGSSASSTKSNLMIRKLRWVELCIAARVKGKPEPTWEQFEQMLKDEPLFKRLNERRKEIARTWYQTSQHLYAGRRYLKMAPMLFGAMLLESELFIPRLWKRLMPR